MTKPPSPRSAHDPTHVNIEDEQDVRFWTAKFGCTEKQLKAAVKKVGSHVEAVRAELGRKVPLSS